MRQDELGAAPFAPKGWGSIEQAKDLYRACVQGIHDSLTSQPLVI